MEEANAELALLFGDPTTTSQGQASLGGVAGVISRTSAAATPTAPPLAAVEPPVGPAASLSHVDLSGRAAMVDVGGKEWTARAAVASARVLLCPAAFALAASNAAQKGDVLAVAQLAGVQAAKQTPSLIPLCHSAPLSWVSVRLSLDAASHCVLVRAEARATGPTGVEMEALTAAAVAGLTVYDMLKAAGKGAQLTDVRLESKKGGRSGTWTRGAD